MASVQDVAAYILGKFERIDTFKLQKLLYYSQAWHLVWDGEPLFDEEVEAWAAGPVIRSIYDHHRGRYTIDAWPWGDASALRKSERATVDAVVHAYGKLTGRQLSRLTHSEQPWRTARAGLEPTQRSDRPISIPEMRAYYAAIDDDDTGATTPVDELTITDD